MKKILSFIILLLLSLNIYSKESIVLDISDYNVNKKVKLENRDVLIVSGYNFNVYPVSIGDTITYEDSYYESLNDPMDSYLKFLRTKDKTKVSLISIYSDRGIIDTLLEMSDDLSYFLEFYGEALVKLLILSSFVFLITFYIYRTHVLK